ncbi:hypothetical protein C1646_776450 [Rhizophagus diaphanus]|nr:hypothetical protein C1646_776450 [Rhizophagus diaphanus] [Rhizophagus sp. MUCL 43196]
MVGQAVGQTVSHSGRSERSVGQRFLTGYDRPMTDHDRPLPSLVPSKPDHLKTKSTIKEKSVAITEETVIENGINDFLEYLLSCEPGPSNSSPIKSEPPVKPEPPAPETAKKNTIEPLV